MQIPLTRNLAEHVHRPGGGTASCGGRSQRAEGQKAEGHVIVSRATRAEERRATALGSQIE
jgi:hypothetical protein